MSDAAEKKAQQRWAIEKAKLDARQLRGISFIKLEDEFKFTMKVARTELEVPDATSNALPNTDNEQWRNAPQMRPRVEGARHKPRQDQPLRKTRVL